jgi:hypothetical protein
MMRLDSGEVGKAGGNHPRVLASAGGLVVVPKKKKRFGEGTAGRAHL